MSSNLVGEMLVGRVDLGGSFQACSASNSAIDAMAVSIVRLHREADELRATIALLETERDLLRVQVQAGSRRATLAEIAESVREKHDPEHEEEEIEN